jgi:two-component sensor histidine kinase
MLKFKFLLVVLLFGTFSFSQNLPVINYSVENGLPSSEVYDSYQDRYGRIWFATDNGVCIYDTYKFKNYGLDKGLTTLVIFDILEDKKGVIWVVTYFRGLLYYDEGSDSFKEPEFNKSLIQIVGNRFITNCCFDKENTLWLVVAFNVIIKVEKNKVIIHDNTNLWDMNNFGFFIHNVDENKLIGYLNASQMHVKKDITMTYNKYRLAFVNKSWLGDGPRGVLSKGNIDIFCYKNLIYSINEKGELHQVYDIGQGFINQLYQDKDNNIWACCQKEGLILFKDGVFDKAHCVKYLRNSNISGINQDREKNYWVSTSSTGVFFIPSININNYLIGVKIVDISLINNKILASSQYGSIYEMRNGSFFLIDQDSLIEIRQLEEIKKQKIVLISTFRHELKFKKYQVAGNCAKVFENKLYVAGKELTIYDQNLDIILKIKNLPTKIYSVLPIRSDFILLGGLNGVFLFNGEKIIPYDYYLLGFIKSQRVNAMAVTKDFFIFGTHGSGLIFQNRKNNKIVSLGNENGILSNSITSLFVENDSVVWIGTPKGVNKLKFTNNLTKLDLISITNKEGLVSNDVNHIVKFQSKYFVSTSKGISVIDSTYKRNVMFTKLYFESLITNFSKNHLIKPVFNGQFTLNNEDRSVQINFKNVSFHNHVQNNQYKYRLRNIGENPSVWIYENYNNVQFTNLKPGTYIFEASLNNSFAEISSFSFSIPPFYFETALFKIAIAFLLAIILFSILKYFHRNRIRNEKLNNLIIDLKLATVKEQLKPHFIFNCLNSLQLYIMRNESDKASDYLAKFSKMVRNGMNYAEKAEITLEDEIQHLTSYLEFENIRFIQNFDFEFEVKANVDISIILIPNMTLQPIVENAIKHGFKNLSYKGKLRIEFEQISSNQINCTITDNGCGFDYDKDLTKSKGLKIVTERIQLINLIYHESVAKLVFENLNPTRPHGTIARIELPMKILEKVEK